MFSSSCRCTNSTDFTAPFYVLCFYTRFRGISVNPLNAELNPICHLLTLVGKKNLLPIQATTALREIRDIGLSYSRPKMGVGGQRHAPAALPPGKTRYPLYRRLGGPQGRSGRVGKISPVPGFDPRTVQPVRSRYTDWAIPACLSLVGADHILHVSTVKVIYNIEARARISLFM